MATLDWPEALIPQQAQFLLRKASAQFESPFNGTAQVVDFIAERWVLSASLAQLAARNPRGVQSFLNQLSGGVNRVRVWNFGHNRGVPLGTLRGAPTLSSGAARGDTSLVITGATAGLNLLRYGGLDLDAGGGVPAGIASHTSGSVSGFSLARGGGIGGPGVAAIVNATSLGTTSADQAGFKWSDVAVTAGHPYTYAADIKGDTNASLRLYADWYSASNVLLGGALSVSAVIPGGFQRFSVSGEAPATAAWARLYVWMHTRTGGTTAAQMYVDNVQFEPGAVATSFAGRPTLKADDMLGCGGQLFQVAADTQLDDAGAGTVPLVNRVRGTISSSTAVAWNRPTCEMAVLSQQAGVLVRPGAIDPAAIDAVEVW